jgi:NAD(P)-dependent dehydrogenase (short-subunit alcohol dehydrogenase family)
VFSLQEKCFMATWFITGTSSGFGRHLTELLLERGDRVAATCREIEALDDLEGRYGHRLWMASLDVTDTPNVKSVVRRAFAELGSIDVVVNNAGFVLLGAAEEISDEQVTQQLATNLTGSIQVTRAALPHLRAQGGGRILQISSIGGQVAFPGCSIYHASKWGIEGFVESLISEVAPFNIQITLVEPGSAKTELAHRNRVIGDTLALYDDTPAGQLRSYVASGKVVHPGDPVKMARAMIKCAELAVAPKRLTLGRDAYELIHTSLTERLAVLEGQKAIAYSTDFDT